ncbi:MAG: cysteine desulfurase family protein [Desulfatibacillaceae bacterium]|nr:cysteine desulfurase family protein [Desulfatibacillaceae bacterium]
MIYLDFNATTPVCQEALDAALPFLTSAWANPSSGHNLGKKAHQGLETARRQAADSLGARPEEIFFTSGGTESDNWALFGVADALASKGRHIITSEVEHPAIINPALFLLEKGFDISFVPVDENCVVMPEAVEKALRPDTILISIMHANNETGAIMPISQIARMAKKHGVLMHTDAAQSVGKIPTNVDELGVDLLSVAGHKIYAPKGVGALFVRKGTPLEPFMRGGGQEAGKRPGTQNVAFNAALGAAMQKAKSLMESEIPRLEKLRNELEERLLAAVPGLSVNSAKVSRLPNTSNVLFPMVWGSALLEQAPDLAASTGAACHGNSGSISPVLAAMGLDITSAKGAVRLSLGRSTSQKEIAAAAAMLAEAWKKIPAQ